MRYFGQLRSLSMSYEGEDLKLRQITNHLRKSEITSILIMLESTDGLRKYRSLTLSLSIDQENKWSWQILLAEFIQLKRMIEARKDKQIEGKRNKHVKQFDGKKIWVYDSEREKFIIDCHVRLSHRSRTTVYYELRRRYYWPVFCLELMLGLLEFVYFVFLILGSIFILL